MIDFTAEDSYFIKGRGTVFTGILNTAYNSLPATVKINNIDYIVVDVERFIKNSGQPFLAGEKVGLLVKLNISDANFVYCPKFIKDNNLFYYLMNNLAWQDEFVAMRGNIYSVTRKSALFGDYDYMYGGIMHHPQPANDEINKLLAKVNQACQLAKSIN